QGFPGTISLSAETLLAQLKALAAMAASAGFQRLVFFNGHGGQIALLQVAAREIQQQLPQLGLLPWFLWSGPQGLLEIIPEPERSQGLHGGRLETSLMLALRPELVGPLPAVFAAGGVGLLAAWMVAGRMHPNLGVPVIERRRARGAESNHWVCGAA
ncbi:MAG: hypothetical protein EBV08_02885, partial [Synechococcaceae bacterium WB6_1B_055]|nr:hypothetical protein [Synechococcaceae bacterium WB6_1B_055]